MQEGPMKDHIDRDSTGIIKAEYITYTVKNGYLVKETSIRQFKKNGDYHDAFISDPLAEVK